MAKAKSPIFEEIRKSVKGNTTFKTYGKRGNQIVIEKRPVLPYSRSTGQDLVRKAYKRLAWQWGTADWIDSLGYDIVGVVNRISGWNAWLKQNQTFLSKDPILLMSFPEGAGTTAHDLTVYGNNGSINGAVWKKSRHGINYLYFDGSTNYVKGGASLDINRLTLVVSLRNIYTGSTQTLYTNSATTDKSAFYLNLYKANAPYFHVNRPDTGDTTLWMGTYHLSGDTHMLAGTYDGQYMKAYLDGVLKNTHDFGSISDLDHSNDNNYYLGENGESNNPIKGNIYTLAVYPRALTDAEIAEIWKNVREWIRMAGL